MLIQHLIQKLPKRFHLINYKTTRLFTGGNVLLSAKPNDKPIQYTTSKAFEHKASRSFKGLSILSFCVILIYFYIQYLVFQDKELSYSEHTSIIIKISLAIFLIYFGILREPNDIDDMLSRELFEIVPDLEIPMIESEINRLEQRGVDTTNLRQKLEDVKKLTESKK